MRQTIKGVIIGAVVAAGVSVLLAQSPTWTTPRTWATDDLLTANQFNSQFRDNLLWLRRDAQLTGTDALLDLGCGTLGTNEVLFSDCTWATIPDFDLHDTVTTAATIVDADRMAFSDEGTAGDPMRYTTAANLADYMQTEVELNADRVTAGSFGAARIPNLPASRINSGTLAPARLCTGTPAATDVCRGDGTWGVVPIGFDMADWSNFDNELNISICPDTAGDTARGTERTDEVVSSTTNTAYALIFATTATPVLNYDVTFTQNGVTVRTANADTNLLAQVATLSTNQNQTFLRLTGSTDSFTPGPLLVRLSNDGGADSWFCRDISRVWMTAA